MKTASALLLALAACAGPAPGTRDARLRDLLDAHHFEAACDRVWGAALRVAADGGYPLAGPDRAIAGLASGEGAAPDATATHAVAGGREAETGAGRDGKRRRVRGDDDVVGCHVTYLAVEHPGERGEHDDAMELALVRKLEPAAAQALEAQARRAPKPRDVGYSPYSVY